MVRRPAPVLLCVAVCLLAAHLHFAAPPPRDASALRVDESLIRVVREGSETRAALKVLNETGAKFKARVTVEVIDPRGAVLATTSIERPVGRGSSDLSIPLTLPFSKLAEAERSRFPWYRLRYRVESVESGINPATGLVSLSEVVADLFELRVVSSRKAQGGTTYRARVRTANPVSQKPVKGVVLNGTLSFAGEAKTALRAVGETDRDGFAQLDFELPRGVEKDGTEGELKVSARLGPFEQAARASVEIEQEPRVLLTTDRSLYQPGQTVHLRALAFDAGDRAMADQEITFLILDEEDDKVAFRAEARTSRYGVAAVDWKVPSSTALGRYWAKVKMGDGEYSYDYQAARTFQLSRYDLPNFAVMTKADRPYYLKGEAAEVEVRGDYLFGQPVKRGRVRVVRQTERRWNYEKQKYETKEERPVEGELDEQGRFVARLDLGADHAELAESGYRRFDDLGFAAYVTDPTTNRTEQRRFNLRITKEPIHVYVNEGRFRQAKGLPLAFYLSTFYADGRPAECDVTVSEVGETSTNTDAADRTHSVNEPDRTVLKVRTNRYGVAKVMGPILRKDEERSNLPLRFVARDGDGRTGSEKDDFWLVDRYDGGKQTELRVETDKTLYRVGEPLEVAVTSNGQRTGVVVDATVRGRVVASRAVRLDGAGRAVVSLPYHEEFQNAVLLSATSTEPEEEDDDDYTYGAKTVIFPRNRELKLDVKMTRASYRPGEQAGVEFAVKTADGERAAGALGVVVFDKAVEERARTEEEFGSAFGFGGSFYNFFYEEGDIAGITQRDIEQLNLSRPVPAGLETVAELTFNSSRPWDSDHEVSAGLEFERNQQTVFQEIIAEQLKPLREALDARYALTRQYPTDQAALEQMLAPAGIEWGALRDPWGRPYRAEFHVKGNQDFFEISSDGADERADTGDEMNVASFSRPYFLTIGERINRAVFEHHARTGGFLRDYGSLTEELRRGGFDLDALRDRWGRAYGFEFDVELSNYRIRIESSGQNGAFEPPGAYASDDFYVWTSLNDYFAGPRHAAEEALTKSVREAGRFPRTEQELRAALAPAGINPAELRDGWGRPIYVTFGSQTRDGDRLRIESRAQYDANAAQQRTKLTPVSRTILEISLRSTGPDGRAGTTDDFNLAYFTSVGAELTVHDRTASAQPVITFSGGAGAIKGTVTDPNGAAISGVSVTARHNITGAEFQVTTKEDGTYLLRNLPSGFYALDFYCPGFIKSSLQSVQVQSSNLTRADVEMNVGGVAETVTVTGGSEVLNTTSSSMNLLETKGAVVSLRAQVSTPRLREFFPETLVWQPSVETDAAGRARLDFKLADNITTWKMSVIASTEDGRLGWVEKEFLAFQPFFAEHDPPRVLTEGDEISLPVVLRNYLERPQPVEVEMKPESWFALIGPARQNALVPAGDAARPTFDFRTVASVEEGRQRVTAVGAEASDAVEKPVTVHPDGEERSQTTAALFGATGALNVRVPSDAIRGSVRSELKIYPNLTAHIMEGVEAIMSRPYGCGEQTISSSYPSIFVLDFYRRTRGGLDGQLPPAVERAQRYARLGYDRLLGYRAAGGGFTYWGRGEPDLALTAYALRFLSDASRVIDVDADLIAETRDWLARRQQPDGSWPVDRQGKADARRTALNTAFVARVLAATGTTEKTAEASGEKRAEASGEKRTAPLARALRYLAARAAEIDEPYLIASYALAASDAGERVGAARAAERLHALARQERTGTYWSLETNTPFYGWGLAGRIETTALAVQALARVEAAGTKAVGARADGTESHVSRGLLFLLDHKDRYGVWHSTQATVNVLEALLSLADAEAAARTRAGSTPDVNGRAEVFVNGTRAGEVTFPPAGELSAPIIFDLTPHLAAGDSRVEIRRAGPAAPAQAQAVTTFYVPWPNRQGAPTKGANGTNGASITHATVSTVTAGATHPKDDAAREQNGTDPLRLAISFDRPTAAINQEITCSVVAERIGQRGYGMMLAEVGLPPGADVDRASLERVMQESGWSVSSYDILPDRLVLYLWPSAGGVKFSFKFRPRYGLNALSAPSQLYDYYNPEARTVLAPTRFVVR